MKSLKWTILITENFPHIILSKNEPLALGFRYEGKTGDDCKSVIFNDTYKINLIHGELSTTPVH